MIKENMMISRGRNYILLIVLFLCISLKVSAQDPARWMQQAAVSPDGKWIAFEYEGNIFKVGFSGGNAIQLTHNQGYCGYPVWNHQSTQIAFASDQNGNFDVFRMDDAGNDLKRLTLNSSQDIPYDFTVDDKAVVFGTARHDVYTSARFPVDYLFNKLYSVPINGGKSIMLNAAGMDAAHFNKTGDQIIFQDRKGLENIYRKHHTSSVTRDIWTYDLKTNVYKQVSSFKGEDLEPVWGETNTFYYLSERDGTLNLFKGFTGDTTKVEQLTHFKGYPIRNLSRADNGQMVFTWKGDLYSFIEHRQPQKILIKIKQPGNSATDAAIPVDGKITEMTVSPDGKQVAFVYRGDVFVSSADGSTTKRITNTPFQERMVSFRPDGKAIICSVERDSSWDIEEISLKNKADSYLYASMDLETKDIIATNNDEFQGVYSPDGSKIAYIENRDVLKSYNLKTGETHVLIPEGVNFSSSDGDQYFVWSPDSRYLLAQSTEGGGGFESEVVLIKDDGSGKRANLTQSTFIDELPQWGMQGRMMYWLSDKLANHTFTLGGSDRDIFGMFFNHATWENFQRLQLDSAVQSHIPHNQLTAGSKNPVEIPIDENVNFPSTRLSTTTTSLAGCTMSADGKAIYYLGKYQENYDLWKIDLTNHKNSLVAKLNLSNGKLQTPQNGQAAFILSHGTILRINLADGKKLPFKINASFNLNAAAERAYLFLHVMHNVKKRFIFPDHNGMNIDQYYNTYKEFLPYINNNYDFVIFLKEFLGELNTSHTTAVYLPDFKKNDETASLGLLYDETYGKKELLVKEILKNGPFDLTYSHLKPGMLITAIDDTGLTEKSDWTGLLNHKAGKPVRITFKSADSKQTFQETIIPVKPAEELNSLLYDRWVHRMEELTDSLSGGKIGYVYVRTMNDEGFRPVYEKALGKYKNREAIIIDTRYNRGGSLHEQIDDFFSGKIYLTERRQGRVTNGGEPIYRWNKPSCIIMSEGNYSDAFLTPYTYQRKGIGKLIGMPVPGTGTASWFENQIDPAVAVQIAVGGTYGDGVDHPTENHQLYPDITVRDDYNSILSGTDDQLKAAVKEMLKELSDQR